jgi:hypothetical protein
MASTHDAGASAHHVILLWPFPILFAATALASLPWRPVAIAAGVGMIGMNLLVASQYISQFERNGATGSFTDAIFSLSASLPEHAENIYILDWGISEPLTYLHRGQLKLPLSGGQEVETHAMLTDPGGLFVGHVQGREFFPRLEQDLEAEARTSGYHKELIQTVADSNGRPVFEVFRFRPN